MRSKKLKKLLEIVLALGNYMNRGQRGNAKGFLISSLNNMVDTKSSLNRHVTLLHYLVEVLEKRVSINFCYKHKMFLIFCENEIPWSGCANKIYSTSVKSYQ